LRRTTAGTPRNKEKDMNKQKHTPGPWQVEYYTGDHGRPTVVKKTPGRVGNPISAVTILFTHDGDAVTEANARLIAAAPDLLAACIQALSSIEVDEESHLRQVVGDVLREAIAKAVARNEEEAEDQEQEAEDRMRRYLDT
jgi:hypothetical protein